MPNFQLISPSPPRFGYAGKPTVPEKEIANETAQLSPFRVVAPGIMLAATGVGAGDLLTGALAGSEAGVSLLWAVVVGAGLKYVLTEGVARWQLATGMTLLDGWRFRLGGGARWFFLAYLTLFTIIVGRALAAACGTAGTALYPLGDPQASVAAWAVIHSLAGAALVWKGSFRAFESIMAALVGLMFVTVLGAAAAVAPPLGEVTAGFAPSIPDSGPRWVLAVLGGVGGTVTLLSYGYWIQEQGRRGQAMLRVCKTDLAVGNGMTGLFGLSVVVIGSQIEVEQGGAALAVQMADRLAEAVGPLGRAVFLAGFWGAVFSSLLGVWQSIPYMFADCIRAQDASAEQLRRSKAYRCWLLLIAVVPLFLLNASVKQIQLVYGIFGAMFLPLLALTLLVMNNRLQWVGKPFRNPPWINAVLAAALVFFAWLGLAG